MHIGVCRVHIPAWVGVWWREAGSCRARMGLGIGALLYVDCPPRPSFPNCFSLTASFPRMERWAAVQPENGSPLGVCVQALWLAFSSGLAAIPLPCTSSSRSGSSTIVTLFSPEALDFTWLQEDLSPRRFVFLSPAGSGKSSTEHAKGSWKLPLGWRAFEVG